MSSAANDSRREREELEYHAARGLSSKLGAPRGGDISASGSCSKTSNAAPLMTPPLSESASACSSMRPPRDFPRLVRRAGRYFPASAYAISGA